MKKNSKTNTEPSRKKSPCVYCGDAPINHRLFYFSSLVSMAVDDHIMGVTRHAPDFLKDFVDWLLFSFFNILLFFRLAKLSDDIDSARTFRSRVIWEEARRRGIDMKHLIMFGKTTDMYRAKLRGKSVYFNSLPIPMKDLNMVENWDDKFVLKQEFIKKNIPVPEYVEFSVFSLNKTEQIFSKFKTPIIVKPRVGSRGRHTVTNIRNISEFKAGIGIAKQICAQLVAEEHLEGYVCRATFVKGKLMGFYRGATPFVVGDGEKTLEELIAEKDSNRPERVEKVLVNEELKNYVLRSGFKMEDVVPAGVRLSLTHRTGRLFGGLTKEMLDELHPSFIPILEEAARAVNLPVIGFDCIVPDPAVASDSQKWGIIECNTLPFIDLHYYALEGKPKNIAGAIWDIWQ
ncbi:MAG: hypothetical protein WAV15_01605 [Minisyncoccia bacterium]